MDEPREKLKITIQGKEYDSLEAVPPQYRPLIEKQLEAARGQAASEARAQPGVPVHKHFDFKVQVKRTGQSVESSSPSALPTSGGAIEPRGTPWGLAALIGAAVAAAAFLLEHHH